MNFTPSDFNLTYLTKLLPSSKDNSFNMQIFISETLIEQGLLSLLQKSGSAGIPFFLIPLQTLPFPFSLVDFKFGSLANFILELSNYTDAFNSTTPCVFKAFLYGSPRVKPLNNQTQFLIPLSIDLLCQKKNLSNSNQT